MGGWVGGRRGRSARGAFLAGGNFVPEASVVVEDGVVGLLEEVGGWVGGGVGGGFEWIGWVG